MPAMNARLLAGVAALWLGTAAAWAQTEKPQYGGALEIVDHGSDNEHNVITRNGEVVDHRGPRHLEHFAVHERSAPIGDVEGHAGLEAMIAEEEKLARLWIELWVGRHSSREPPVEIILTERLQRPWP